MSPEPPSTSNPPPPAPVGSARWIVAALVVLAAAYCWHLWPEWSHNADLSHGFFTPFVCLLLLAESRRQGVPRWLPPGGARDWLPAAAITVAVAVFALAGLLAASVGWTHVLVEFLLSVTLASTLLAGFFCLASAQRRVLPLNWITLTAAGIWILSAPLPSGTYARLTLALQSWVSSGVINSLQLLGVPARQHGNIIELARTTVGVEEACSGIRSLLSCTYAGFFFAAWQVRSGPGRALLIVLTPLLAIGMNFLRSLTLTLLANAGVEIAGFWHDATGFAILGLTAALLALLALKLSPRLAAGTSAVSSLPPPVAPPAGGSARAFGTGLGVLALLMAVFAFYGRSAATGPVSPSFNPEAALPTQADGWRVSTATDIHEFFGVLRTTELVERTYTRPGANGPTELVVYIAHWTPGQAPVSLVASHTPDACWPGAGWLPQANPTPQPVLTLAGRPLPRTEHRIFQSANSAPQQVWFWHVYDGHVISYRDPYSVPALLELALRYGFQREGEQYFIRISSNRPWEQLAPEPLLTEIITNLARIGLTP